MHISSSHKSNTSETNRKHNNAKVVSAVNQICYSYKKTYL